MGGGGGKAVGGGQAGPPASSACQAALGPALAPGATPCTQPKHQSSPLPPGGAAAGSSCQRFLSTAPAAFSGLARALPGLSAPPHPQPPPSPPAPPHQPHHHHHHPGAWERSALGWAPRAGGGATGHPGIVPPCRGCCSCRGASGSGPPPPLHCLWDGGGLGEHWGGGKGQNSHIWGVGWGVQPHRGQGREADPQPWPWDGETTLRWGGRQCPPSWVPLPTPKCSRHLHPL